MTGDNQKSAILILTHLNNQDALETYTTVSSECSETQDVFILCDNSKKHFENRVKDDRYFLFSKENLTTLPFPGKSAPGKLESPHEADWHHQRFNFDPGNVDLPIHYFFNQFPNYAHYWVIEYDVRFSGAWRDFFSTYETSDADLIGTTMTRRTATEDWFHWPSLDLLDRKIEKRNQIRGFFPIYRLSSRALRQLDADYRSGVGGHFECLIPTLLHDAGMTIEDIGGSGEFVRPANVNRFYRNTPTAASLGPGTFVFRPVMEKPGVEPNMLWHPVRPALSLRARSRQRTGTLLRLAGRVASRIGSPFRDIR